MVRLLSTWKEFYPCASIGEGTAILRRASDPEAAVRSYPLPTSSQKALLELITNAKDFLPTQSRAEKIDFLRRISYSDFLRKFAGMPEDVVVMLRDTIKGLWGVGWDALSALEGYRLLSTAVDVRHTADGKAVDVTYVRDGTARRVRSRHAILAGYNMMIPWICSEVPPQQKEAIEYATKVPLVYINIALRNWQAFAKQGYHSFYVPNSGLMHYIGMDFPVSMGRYRYTDNPDDPTVIHGAFVPTSPDQGLLAREQHKAGRGRLYEMSFDEFERGIVRQMNGALGPGGFDAARDIAAITVNRWPHGYAYEYNEYSDPVDWNPDKGPHIAGRAQIGRISIANSDAAAYAYADGAIDAADRAVNEQIALG